jgi:tetratricopeptide (TPR) repeat protein/KaiC/GvpD/RAD55 family RecA-like ATPase
LLKLIRCTSLKEVSVLAEPALVGRERELEKLETFLNSAAEGKGATVFVTGEAGAGKTRVTREFLKIAKKRGAVVLAGWCLSDAAIPYFPFERCFDSYFSSLEKENPSSQTSKTNGSLIRTGSVEVERLGITAWLTGMKHTNETQQSSLLSPEIWKDQLFAAVGKTLQTLSFQGPLVLFIEDIHWADSASLALLHFISRIINSDKILVLATFRHEELIADSEGHPHPLTEMLRAMRREDLFAEIRLTNLNDTNISKIAENMIGGALQQEFAEKLAKESRGNPLFILESIEMLREHKGLVKENDEWRLAVDELGIPSKIRDIFLRRLAVLKYAQRRLLDAASVIGERFDLELLSAILRLDSLEVLENLNVIDNSTSLLRVEENCYSFDHATSRETLYEELSLPLKRGYHARIAERLESTSQENKLPLSEIAHHYAQAGNKEKAVKYSLAAGQDSLRKWSNSEAIKHFAYVLNTIGDTLEDSESNKIALEGLGDAYWANCMFDKAAESFEKLTAFANGSLKLRAYRKAMEVIWYKDMNPVILMESIKKVEELATSDRMENARMIWNRGRAFLFLGDLKRALEDHEAALQIFKEEYSLPDVANLLGGTGATRGIFPIKLECSNTEFERSFGEKLLGTALTHELGYGQVESTCINIFVGGTFYSIGFFQEALTSYNNALKIGEKTGDFNNMSFALACIGELLGLISTSGVEGTPQLEKALEYALKTDSELTKIRIYANLAIRYMRLMDFERAEKYYNELMNMPKEIVSHLMVSLNVEIAKIVPFVIKNQWKEAKQSFENNIEGVKNLWPQSIGYEIVLRKNYAWMLETQGRAEEAEVQLLEARRIDEEIQKRFAHSKLYANFLARSDVSVGEEFEMRFDIVNIGKSPGVLTQIEELIPSEFKIIKLPAFCSVQEDALKVKDKYIDPFQVLTIKLNLKAQQTGNYSLNPTINYVNDLGENQSFKPDQVKIEVHSIQPTFEALPGRVKTGCLELDRLLLGGIPEKCAVVLTAPSSDERALLVNSFLKAGVQEGENTFNISTETANKETVAQEHPSDFHLFLCNPQAGAMIKELPNVIKLKGVENLTDIDISLNKAFRRLEGSKEPHRRVCIEILSDVLLLHRPVNTRRWLSALLPTLKSKDFTILAVIDPSMHPSEDLQAVLGVFDGEIRIAEEETPEGAKQVLKIKKLINQKYLDEEIVLKKETLND